jgi:hypothetical protein
MVHCKCKPSISLLLAKTATEKQREKEYVMRIKLTVEREKLGLTQARLAAATPSMHPSSVCQIEAGRNPGFKQRYLLEQAMKDAGWNGEGDLFAEAETD